MTFQLKALLTLAVTAIAANTASADYLSGNMGSVQNLAQQIANDSAQARYEAQRYATYGNYAEQDAIARLSRLEYAAQDFDRAVDNYYYNPSGSRYEFDRLNSEFIAAESTFTYLTAYRYVSHLFNNLRNNMASLRYYYGVPGYNPPYYPAPQPPYYPPHQPGYPNPPARPVYPQPPYRPAPPVYPAPPYRPAPPVYRPAPPRPAPPYPGNPGHTPGRPNPPARPIGPRP